MTFETFKTFQASLETSIRELGATQLALVQTFVEKQKTTLSSPTLLTPKSFTDNQALLQEFAKANQIFFTDSFMATRAYWRAQFAENQTALQAAGIPNVKDVAAQLQATIEKFVAPVKTARAKR